jgi:hypothetical protein
MVEITGSAEDRRYAVEVADWCARELAKARENGSLETRPFVQNADMIIAALREYATGGSSLSGKAAPGPSFAEITKDLPRRSGESD